MGKAKKTRKFAEVKRLLNPKDLKPYVGHALHQTWEPKDTACSSKIHIWCSCCEWISDCAEETRL